MSILAIDYGRRKIGLAFASSLFAEPYEVIRVESQKDALQKIEKIIFSFAETLADKKIETIVIGVSEGRMAEETREFAVKLKELTKIPVVFQDETLSTQEAQRLTIDAKVSRKKRRELEDAYSAALILQNYLDEKHQQ